MKRWMWIILCILAFQILELPEGAVEQLQPVRLLMAEKEEKQIILKTDTGAWGRGNTLEEALDHMKAGASGRIFLETADLLLLNEQAQYLLPELGILLRPAVRVCLTESTVNPEKAGVFLGYHRPETNLGGVLGEEKIHQILIEEGGNLYLEEIPEF